MFSKVGGYLGVRKRKSNTHDQIVHFYDVQTLSYNTDEHVRVQSSISKAWRETVVTHFFFFTKVNNHHLAITPL